MRELYLILCIFLAMVVELVAASPKTIPFRLIDKLIVIQAQINGESGNFILDTGVPNLVLNASYFKGEPTENTFYGLTGIASAMGYTYSRLQIGAHHWKKTYADVIEMDHLQEVAGVPIHGLLGSNLFRNFTLFIDLEDRQVALYPLDKAGEHHDFPELLRSAEILPFRYKGSSPLIEAAVNEIPLKMVLDTGASTNLINEKHEQELQAMLRAKKRSVLVGLGRESRAVTSGQLSKIVVGRFDCQPMYTLFATIDHWNQYVPGPMVDGILGYEFLSQFRVAINFKKREMYLWGEEQEEPAMPQPAIVAGKADETNKVGSRAE